MKEVAIAGGTGFIGSRLAKSLKKSNYDVKLIPSKILRMEGVGARTFGIDFKDHDYKLVSEFIDGSYALINLAGEPLCEIWRSDTRSRIYSSRVDLTHLLVNAINYCHERPELFINTSSTEYYGNKGDKTIKESSPPGATFLSRVLSENGETILYSKYQGFKSNTGQTRISDRITFLDFQVNLHACEKRHKAYLWFRQEMV